FFAIRERYPAVPAVLADTNAELIACFTQVRDDVEALIGALGELERAYHDRNAEERKAFYYEVRACEPREPVAIAARTIFLNRTGYNGLYRVNRQGRFNVPHGRYKNPRILDGDGLRAAAE